MAHAFLSYVRTDRELVHRLASELKGAGVGVWIDREQIKPGQRWQSVIAEAIEKGTHFLACFSKAYQQRDRSYMNEELTLAVDELRTRPHDRAWFLPLRLDDCDIPAIRIGGGDTLRDIQWVDLHEDWSGGLRALLKELGPHYITQEEREEAERHERMKLHLSHDQRLLKAGSRAPRLPPETQITCIQDGIVHFALTKEGQLVGGTAALRRVSADLLQGDWNGDVEIHHAFLDGIQQDIRDLLAHGGLSADQGKKLERLRSQAAWVTSSIQTVCFAVRLTFVSAASREPTWGVPMQTEEALTFLAGLFVEARLAPRSASCDVPCQLYVPDRVRDPVCIDLRLSESEAKEMRESWERELMRFDDTKWRSWDWSDLVPIWHLSDKFIAARLLPAIAISIAGRVRRSPPHTTMADAWEDLRQVYSPTTRDPLVPYHWCLALQSDRSSKDLAWLTSPPYQRRELHTVLGLRR